MSRLPPRIGGSTDRRGRSNGLTAAQRAQLIRERAQRQREELLAAQTQIGTSQSREQRQSSHRLSRNDSLRGSVSPAGSTKTSRKSNSSEPVRKEHKQRKTMGPPTMTRGGSVGSLGSVEATHTSVSATSPHRASQSSKMSDSETDDTISARYSMKLESEETNHDISESDNKPIKTRSKSPVDFDEYDDITVAIEITPTRESIDGMDDVKNEDISKVSKQESLISDKTSNNLFSKRDSMLDSKSESQSTTISQILVSNTKVTNVDFANGNHDTILQQGIISSIDCVADTVKQGCSYYIFGEENLDSTKVEYSEEERTILRDKEIPRESIITSNETSESEYPAIFIANIEYPWLSPGFKYEQFPLLVPKKIDEYDPVLDVANTAQFIITSLIDKETSQKHFGTELSMGILRRIQKAFNKRDAIALKSAISEFNGKIRELRSQGYFKEPIILDNKPNADELVKKYKYCVFGSRERYRLVSFILDQSYARAVSKNVKLLVQYKTFSNNVYGEVKANFVDRIIKEAAIKLTDVFLDMGSGVGNVVLQVAAQCGCDSYGVEIMENPSMLGSEYLKEFTARTKAFSLPCGRITLIHGDFLIDNTIHKLLSRVDVIFLNNYLFDTTLLQNILAKFLDLKDGCRIITMKPLTPVDRKVNSRGDELIDSIYSVTEYFYGEDSVSWMNEGGSFYVHKVNRRGGK